jgi:hypothetical protein
MPQELPVLFGGVPTTLSPEVFENARKNNPAWSQILEKAYAAFAARPENAGVYADPTGKGATLEQSWLVFTLYGVEPYCLLARPVPAEQIGRITRVVRQTPPELVQTLMRLRDADGAINATTLHYDGRTGHCIRLTAYDAGRDRFVYHDPWPERSLLCKDNNMAGVDAQPEGTRWSVTAKELERVIFASFAFPHQWARLQGVDFDLTFERWRESEFFKAFHLKQTAERSENGMARRMFTAGPFKDSVTLIVDHWESGKIVEASLLLDKTWMAKNIALALDISRSFVAAIAPAPDRTAYDEIGAALRSLRNPQSALAMKNRDPGESTVVQCVHSFMGSVESASMTTDFASLSFRNVAHEQERLQEIEFALL